ncbi:glycosyltransferase family 4 protein [Neisseriaceae bacterium TC5R-5]|nr:glycosyltransferase family 4 protein [Neisseriaceae bacterium TC5R-5]
MAESIQKVLIVGSASVHTWRYLNGIAPHVAELYLASNEGPSPEQRPPNLVASLCVDFRLTALRTATILRSWIEQIEPQLIHIHQANSVAWHTCRAASSMGIPILLTTWGSDVLLLPQRSWLMRQLVRSNLLAADAITADSLYLAAKVRELAGEVCQIHLLNYGIDSLPVHTPVSNKPYKVLSCRLHKPLYRIDAILHAWQRVELSEQFAHWSLTIAANGSETAALQQLAAALQLRRVTFTGFVSSQALAELYAESRVFVSVPTSDATSISLLEALGHGCLPLLSNLPANGEWVIDGLNGCIAEDIHRLDDDLLRSIALASDDTHLQQIADTNRELVTQKALHQNNMARFAELYRELVQ